MFNSDAFDSEDNSAKWSTEERKAYNLVRESVIKALNSKLEIFSAEASTQDVCDLGAVIRFLCMSKSKGRVPQPTLTYPFNQLPSRG